MVKENIAAMMAEAGAKGRSGGVAEVPYLSHLLGRNNGNDGNDGSGGDKAAQEL